VPERKHRQEKQECLRQPAVPLQGLRGLQRARPTGKGYPEEEKKRILRAYRERGRCAGSNASSESAATRSRAGSKKASAEALADTLAPAREGDVLELDEAWSFVGKKDNKR